MPAMGRLKDGEGIGEG